MKRLLLPLLLVAAPPALASPLIDYPDPPAPASDGVVEIPVPPEDLARCRATLAAVLTPVMPPADGATPVAAPDAGPDPDLPVAVCVVERARS